MGCFSEILSRHPGFSAFGLSLIHPMPCVAVTPDLVPLSGQCQRRLRGAAGGAARADPSGSRSVASMRQGMGSVSARSAAGGSAIEPAVLQRECDDVEVAAETA